jgi:hypothetical protein
MRVNSYQGEEGVPFHRLLEHGPLLPERRVFKAQLAVGFEQGK